MAKNFIGKKKKFTNKGNDMHEDTDSRFHNTMYAFIKKTVEALLISTYNVCFYEEIRKKLSENYH